MAKSIKMLKAILDGKTYVTVAQESGLTRSAVEQRVKALARDLQTVVGVEWVDEDEVPTVKGMRARKDNYLEALEHYRPQHFAGASKGSRALTSEDIERAVAMTRRHSDCRIGSQFRSTLPTHAPSPSRSCVSLRSLWSAHGRTSASRIAPKLGAHEKQAARMAGRLVQACDKCMHSGD